MPSSSKVQIKIVEPDGTQHDVTQYVLFSTAQFQYQANALPGTFEFTLKDVDRTLVFGSPSNNFAGINTGAEVYLYIDDVKQYGGILMQIDRVFAFDVVDTSDLSEVSARQFNLRGVDFNIWFDKRVLRNTANYKSSLRIPGVWYDGKLIRQDLPDYLDLPPGLVLSSADIENIERFGAQFNEDGSIKKVTGWVPGAQGDPWRKPMELLSWRSGAVYYIDADKHLVFKSLETARSPINFTDHNPTTAPPEQIPFDVTPTIGVREVMASQDGSPIITEALVWGGLEELASSTEEPDPSGVFFGRYPKPPANDDQEQDAIDAQERYGLWQYAETNFSQGDDQYTVNLRARILIMGPPGSGNTGVTGGLRHPVWDVSFAWFAHQVKRYTDDYIRPGQVATILLYAMGRQNGDKWIPLALDLPLRTVTITFPQIPEVNEGQYRTWVKFQGQFGINYSDNRQIWKFLKRIHQRASTYAAYSDWQNAGLVTPESTTARVNAPGEMSLTPDGTTTVFNVQRSGPTDQPYLAGTTQVYLNGLLQRPGFEYEESDPTTGEITFYTAPLEDDTVWIEYRAAGV